MKCLSVRQPWAWAICAGFKTVENRSWPTNYRGWVAIHAGERQDDVKSLVKDGLVDQAAVTHLQYGKVIGAARLADVLPLSPALEDNPWATGEYCWVFEDARVFEQVISLKGQLRLFALPADAMRAVADQLASGRRLLQDSDRTFAEAVRPDPFDTEVRRAYSYDSLGAWDSLLRVGTRLIGRDPSRAEGYLARSFANWELKRISDALRDCNAAIERDDRNANAYALRHDIHRELGNYDAARADAKKATELEPAYGDAREEGEPGGG